MKKVAIRRGAALVVALVTLLVVMLLTGTLLRSLLAAHRQARQRQEELQAQWLAEAAVDRARAQLAAQADFAGETWEAVIGETAGESAGVAQIRVERVDSQMGRVRILVEAHYPGHEWRRVAVTRDYTLNRAPAAAGASEPHSETLSENAP
jgi:Tfp pilus assembly protein PilV